MIPNLTSFGINKILAALVTSWLIAVNEFIDLELKSICIIPS